MNILNNQTFANVAQNTLKAVAIETTLKACGRPTFIYLDKNTKPETKKYSASKEFLYQALCLGIYLTIIPFFKKGGYSIAKKVFKGDADVERVFERCSQSIESKKGKMIKDFKRFMEEYTEAKHTDTVSPEMAKIKGGVEATSIVGSVLGLALFAPEISHVILHPVMNALGLNKKAPEAPLNKTV